jgi:hypothetical protein
MRAWRPSEALACGLAVVGQRNGLVYGQKVALRRFAAARRSAILLAGVESCLTAAT